MTVNTGRRAAIVSCSAIALAIIAPTAGRAQDEAGGDMVPHGARALPELMDRLRKAPRRRDFRTVPMILDHPDLWDETALKEVIAYRGVGKQVWDKLKYHPAFLERIKYTQRGQVTPEIAASLFEVDKILIGAAGKNTATEGQTDSMSYIWGKDMLLAYVAPRIQPKMLTLGFNYQWAKKSKNVKRLRGTDEEDRNGTYVRVGDDYYDMNIVAASCGYLMKTVVS